MNSPAVSPCGTCSWDSHGPTSTVPSAGRGFAIANAENAVSIALGMLTCCWRFGCCSLLQMHFRQPNPRQLDSAHVRVELRRLLHCGH